LGGAVNAVGASTYINTVVQELKDAIDVLDVIYIFSLHK
jgi:hypothetical protein